MPIDAAVLSQLPDTLTVDVDGKATALRETPFVKEAPDLPTLIKNGYEAHREVGARIPVRIAKPEDAAAWRTEHMPKLYKAGILEAPPSKPEEYGVTKPENLPEGIVWSDERAGKFSGILHKYGVPKAAAAELMALNMEGYVATNAALKTSHDEGIAALKKEYGADFDQRQEQASRLAASIFKTDAELKWFEDVGLANHPTFLSILMRLAPLAAQDSSVLAGLPSSSSGGLTGEEVRKEIADIMSNPQNARNKLYWQRDKATMDYVEGLYKKAYGDATVTIT